MALAAVVTGSVVAAAATLAGVYLVVLSPGFTRRASRFFVALAGGTVLGAVFLHLLPEAVALAGTAAWFSAIASFLVLYLVESHTLPHVHGPHSGDAEGPHIHLGHLAALGFAAHASFDGLALGAAYRQGVGLAMPALIAVFAHKVPEGMALVSLLHHGGFDERHATRLSWGVAFMTPVVAVASYLLLGGRLQPVHMGIALAFVAGSFLYISACDLLPEVRRSPRVLESLLILAGVALMAALRLL